MASTPPIGPFVVLACYNTNGDRTPRGEDMVAIGTPVGQIDVRRDSYETLRMILNLPDLICPETEIG